MAGPLAMLPHRALRRFSPQRPVLLLELTQHQTGLE